MVAEDIKILRDRLHLSQANFALKFGINLRTLRDWEQGRASPDSAARVLLTVVAFAPDTVDRALEQTRVVAVA